MKSVAAKLLIAVFPLIASAHHSRAEFADEIQEFEGEIVRINWTNPHPRIDIKVVSDDEILQIQVYGGPTSLARAGVTDELFRIGDNVTIVGRRSTVRPNYALGTDMLLTDGREAILTRTVEPYWSGEYVGGLETFIASGPQLANAASENRGLFRVWSRFQATSVIRYLPLTETASAIQSQFDLIDNWRTRGEEPGMPMVMFDRSNFEFSDRGTSIIIRHVERGIVRTIHLVDSDTDDYQPPSKLGYSAGYWEGETLVVITKRINWPHFDINGIPLSEAVEVTERYTLSDDQGRLDLHMTITDPATFTEPATVEMFWLAYETLDE